MKFLIHVHDTFKADALANSPIQDPQSHASLAKAFASEFIDDEDLLNMLQFHDVNYSLWQQWKRTGSYDVERLTRLVKTIRDWDLFMMFLIVDGSTEGKESSKLIGFIQEAAKYRESTVDESWVLGT